MTWQLPLDNDIHEALDLAASSRLQPLKAAAFRRHLATALPAAAWVELDNAPTGYLRELYPKIYLYGPRATAAEAFGNGLATAYDRHGVAVLREMPRLVDISSEEFDHLDACLAVECRPHGEDRPDYTSDLENTLRHIAANRGYELPQYDHDNIQWVVSDLIEITLAMDIIPHLPYFAEYLAEYNAYRARWGIA